MGASIAYSSSLIVSYASIAAAARLYKCRKQQSRVNQTDTISRIRVRCSVVNMSKSCCFAVVLAVICLSVILLSLEADARPSGGKTSSKVRGSSTVDEVFNMVKVVAPNQKETAKEVNNDIKNLKTQLSSGSVEMNEADRLDELKEEMKGEISELKETIASGLAETSDKILKLSNDVKGVKTMLTSGAVQTNETRMEALVKEMKDDMEEVVQESKDEISNEMDVQRDEVVKTVKNESKEMEEEMKHESNLLMNEIKGVKTQAVETKLDNVGKQIKNNIDNKMTLLGDKVRNVKRLLPFLRLKPTFTLDGSKQSLVFALVCEYLIMAANINGQAIIFLPCGFFFISIFLFLA